MQNELIDVKRVAEKLEVSKNTIYRRIRNGMFLKPYSDGRNSRWLTDEVEIYKQFVFGLPTKALSDCTNISEERINEIRYMALKARARNPKHTQHNNRVAMSPLN